MHFPSRFDLLWCRAWTTLLWPGAAYVYVCVKDVSFIYSVLYKQVCSCDSETVCSSMRLVSDRQATRTKSLSVRL
jgi:hypothetical protein